MYIHQPFVVSAALRGRSIVCLVNEACEVCIVLHCCIVKHLLHPVATCQLRLMSQYDTALYVNAKFRRLLKLET